MTAKQSSPYKYYLGLACIAGLLSLKSLGLSAKFITESAPDLTLEGINRSLVIFLITLLVMSFFPPSAFISKTKSSNNFLVSSLPKFLQVYVQIALYLFILGSWSVFKYSPQIFNRLVWEGGGVESLSVIFYVLAFIVFAGVLIQIIKHFQKTFIKVAWPAMFLALTAFVIGMEEISWGQNYLGYGIPEFLKSNKQGEMNFHNMATNVFENIYYVGAFLLFVIFPFIAKLTLRRKKNSILRFYVPSGLVMLIGISTTVYTYDMWNIFWMQGMFFIGLMIIGIDGYLTDEEFGGHKGAWLALLVLVQTVFILDGADFIRSWDVTEYRECVIPFAFLVYSIELWYKDKPSFN